MKRILTLFLLIWALCSGATKYVAQSAAGANDGSSAGNAYSVAQLNAASPYSPAAGDTVILNGTITSQIVVPTSGSVGQPITYLFATGTKMSAAFWPAAQGAIQINSKNYITVDGAATGTIGGPSGNVGLINGIIECTANGTSLANQVSCGAVVCQSAQNLTIKNLVMQNIYVRTGTTDQNQYGACVENLATGADILNFSIDNCIINNGFFGVSVDGGDASSGYTLTNLNVYNCNHAISVATRTVSSNHVQTVSIHNNWLHDWAIWNDTASNSHHHNGVFLKSDSGILEGVNIYANKFGPGFGGTYQTAAIYMNTGIKTVNMYNNVFYANPGEFSSNAMITAESTQITTIQILNNTFLNDANVSISCSGSNGLIPGSNVNVTYNVRNNLGSTSNGFGWLQIHYSPGATLNFNNNFGFGYTFSSNPYDFSSTGSGNTMTFATWQSNGFDAAGGYGVDPVINTTTYVPSAVAIGTGSDQSGTFTTDYNGVTRTLPWDVGALKAGTGGSTFTFSMMGKITLAGQITTR